MAAEDDEVGFIVMEPYAHHLQIVLYPTSRIVRANCGHLCWLSPQGEDHYRTESGFYSICVRCLEATYQPVAAETMAVPGAVQALEELWGPDVGAGVREEMRRRGIGEL